MDDVIYGCSAIVAVLAILISLINILPGEIQNRWVMVLWLSCVAICVSLCGVTAYVHKRVWETSKQAQKAGSTGPKPRMSIDLTKVIIDPYNPPKIAIQFRNGGTASAHKFRSKIWCYYRGSKHCDKRLEKMPPKPEDATPVIDPGAIYSAVLSLQEVNPDVWHTVVAGIREMFVLLKVRYEDVGGKEYKFDRVWRYSPSINHLMFAKNEIWPENFDPDS